MATTRLLKTRSKTFSDIELTKYVNNYYSKGYANIVDAVASAGVSGVGIAVKKPVAAAIAAVLGLAISTTVAVNAIMDGLDKYGLKNTIARMKKGQKLKVTTKFYEWSSGNGNSYTYYTVESFSIV